MGCRATADFVDSRGIVVTQAQAFLDTLGILDRGSLDIRVTLGPDSVDIRDFAGYPGTQDSAQLLLANQGTQGFPGKVDTVGSRVLLVEPEYQAIQGSAVILPSSQGTLGIAARVDILGSVERLATLDSAGCPGIPGSVVKADTADFAGYPGTADSRE